MADGCAACCVIRNGGDDEEWFLHTQAEYTAGPAELSTNGCDNFRKALRYAKDSDTP